MNLDLEFKLDELRSAVATLVTQDPSQPGDEQAERKMALELNNKLNAADWMVTDHFKRPLAEAETRLREIMRQRQERMLELLRLKYQVWTWLAIGECRAILALNLFARGEMPEIEPGTKVVAIAGAQDGVIYSFGRGVYQGDVPAPPEAAGINLGQCTPKILLDCGDVVYGCECIWTTLFGMEKRFDAMWQWKYVTVAQFRRTEMLAGISNCVQQPKGGDS